MGKVHVLQTGLPHWLLPKRMDPAAPVTDADLQLIFDEMVKGYTLASILRDHPGLPDRSVIMRYVMSDPELESKYYEQKRIQTEAYVDLATDKLLGRTDEDVPLDIETIKAQVGHLMKLAALNNRKRYGEVKQLQLQGELDIAGPMARAEQRVVQGVTIENED